MKFIEFYEKIILKDSLGFQTLTKEEKRKHLTLFRHKYLSRYLANKLSSPKFPSFLYLLFIINPILHFTINKVASNIILYITMSILIPLLCIYLYTYYIKNIKHCNNVNERLAEKIQNICFLDTSVISFKDWIKLKKIDKEFYNNLHSEACNNKCYFTTYDIANLLKDPNIKILWICAEVNNTKFGHSVIIKNNKIYDSNLRRTFKMTEYLKVSNAKIFKAYPIEEYLNDNYYSTEYFHFLDWEEFGNWCSEQNAIWYGNV